VGGWCGGCRESSGGLRGDRRAGAGIAGAGIAGAGGAERATVTSPLVHRHTSRQRWRPLLPRGIPPIPPASPIPVTSPDNTTTHITRTGTRIHIRIRIGRCSQIRITGNSGTGRNTGHGSLDITPTGIALTGIALTGIALTGIAPTGAGAGVPVCPRQSGPRRVGRRHDGTGAGHRPGTGRVRGHPGGHCGGHPARCLAGTRRHRRTTKI